MSWWWSRCFGKEFKLVAFDAEFAGANGFPIGFINALMSTLIVVTIVLGLQLAGVILMVGMLIAPAIAARQWTHSLEQMTVLAAVFGAFAGGVGAVGSALDSDIPTGPMIIVVAFVLVMASITLAPGRGLLWRRLRQRANRRRFAAINTLRDMHRYALAHGADDHPIPDDFIRAVRARSVEAGLRQLSGSNLVTKADGGWRLTDSGIERARKDRRNQDLWDAYRLFGAELGLPDVQEDRHLAIEAVLPASALEQLDSKLEQGETP